MGLARLKHRIEQLHWPPGDTVHGGAFEPYPHAHIPAACPTGALDSYARPLVPG